METDRSYANWVIQEYRAGLSRSDAAMGCILGQWEAVQRAENIQSPHYTLSDLRAEMQVRDDRFFLGDCVFHPYDIALGILYGAYSLDGTRYWMRFPELQSGALVAYHLPDTDLDPFFHKAFALLTEEEQKNIRLGLLHYQHLPTPQELEPRTVFMQFVRQRGLDMSNVVLPDTRQKKNDLLMMLLLKVSLGDVWEQQIASL